MIVKLSETQSGGKMKFQSTKRWWLTGLIALLAVVAAACGDDSASQTASTTTASAPAAANSGSTTTTGTRQSGPNTPAPKPLATMTTLKAAVAGKSFEAYINILLADKMGEFKKENLQVDISVLPVPEIVASVLSGQLDVGPLGVNAGPLNAISGGSDLAIVAAFPTFRDDSKQGVWVRTSLVAADGTLDPCKMKGMTIALGSPGLSNTITLSLSRYLAKCNLSLNDIKVSTLQGADQLVALQNGAIDGAYLADPLWADASQKGYAKLIVPFGTFSLNGYMMGKLRKDKPDVAAAFVRAMVRTSRTYLQGNYRDNPAVKAAMLDIMGIPAATLDATTPLVFDPDLKFKNSTEATEMQKIWIGLGNVLSFKDPLPPERYLDESILDKVLAE
jgi:NitT/TauT family transport system substrate-binding protein